MAVFFLRRTLGRNTICYGFKWLAHVVLIYTSNRRKSKQRTKCKCYFSYNFITIKTATLKCLMISWVLWLHKPGGLLLYMQLLHHANSKYVLSHACDKFLDCNFCLNLWYKFIKLFGLVGFVCLQNFFHRNKRKQTLTQQIGFFKLFPKAENENKTALC